MKFVLSVLAVLLIATAAHVLVRDYWPQPNGLSVEIPENYQQLKDGWFAHIQRFQHDPTCFVISDAEYEAATQAYEVLATTPSHGRLVRDLRKREPAPIGK